MSEKPFQRDRLFTAGAFTLHADRKPTPFISLRSGLSHKGGSIQHILSIDEARELAAELQAAADFAATPLPGGS